MWGVAVSFRSRFLLLLGLCLALGSAAFLHTNAVGAQSGPAEMGETGWQCLEQSFCELLRLLQSRVCELSAELQELAIAEPQPQLQEEVVASTLRQMQLQLRQREAELLAMTAPSPFHLRSCSLSAIPRPTASTNSKALSSCVRSVMWVCSSFLCTH
jgi:hypothetical protein